MEAQRVIEVGRYKGGSTLVIACAMGAQGASGQSTLGRRRLACDPSPAGASTSSFTTSSSGWGSRPSFWSAIRGPLRSKQGPWTSCSSTATLSYEGVRSDFDRFGRRVRVGGAVLLDDTFDEDMFKTHSDSVGRLAREILDEGDFKLARSVNAWRTWSGFGNPRCR